MLKKLCKIWKEKEKKGLILSKKGHKIKNSQIEMHKKNC